VAGYQHDYKQHSKQLEPQIRNRRTNGLKQKKMQHKTEVTEHIKLPISTI
jgi:hypothetical protein